MLTDDRGPAQNTDDTDDFVRRIARTTSSELAGDGKKIQHIGQQRVSAQNIEDDKQTPFVSPPDELDLFPKGQRVIIVKKG